ncbi:MAG: zinc-binding dehydrogenase [Rhodothermales bacterium]
MAHSMQALVNYAPASGSVEMRSLSLPEIEHDQVLLKVKAVGVCGSDLHQWHGTHSWPVNYPCTLGHEFGGEIVQLGKNVKAFKEGDRVVSETAAVINTQSPFSKKGLYNLDPSRLGFGYGVDGAMAKYVAVPERCLHNIPASLDLNTAALTEPCCVAYNAVCMNSQIKPGDTVLVIGPGPIGLLCGKMAKLSGAGTVIMAGLPNDAFRLEIAKKMGADITVTENVWQTVQSINDGLGVDLVIDAAGVSATLELAMQCVRPAGQITKVGWGPQPLNFSLDPLVQKAVTLQGTFSHNWPTWERIIQMLGSGQLDISPIISQVAPLDAWHSCFDKMLKGEYVKAVLNP